MGPPALPVAAHGGHQHVGPGVLQALELRADGLLPLQAVVLQDLLSFPYGHVELHLTFTLHEEDILHGEGEKKTHQAKRVSKAQIKLHPKTYPSRHLTYLLTYLPTYLPTYLLTFFPSYLPTYYILSQGLWPLT